MLAGFPALAPLRRLLAAPLLPAARLLLAARLLPAASRLLATPLVLLPTATILAVLLAAPSAHAQTNWFTCSYQNVPLCSEKTELSAGGLSDFNRFRLTSEPTFGQFSIEIAYEQLLTFRQHKNDLVPGIGDGIEPGGGEWLDLQWTIVDEEHVLWRHRLDRLNITWRPNRRLEFSAGRQAVSWATTLFLTPADPFTPFDPADPFRVFRAGVDALRARVYPNALSEIDVVVRPTKSDFLGEEMTALARGLTAWKGWEVSGWGGSLYGDTSGAFGLAGDLAGMAVRGEGVVRRVDENTVFRGSIGIDRQLNVNGKDLFLLLEYQHDGLAAASAEEYLDLFRTDPFIRGELQVLGRNETAVQASYQLHPLWGISAMWLWNLNDRSTLIGPSFSHSASDEATVSGGAFFGFGDDEPTEGRPLPSEYGLAGATLWVSASLFF